MAKIQAKIGIYLKPVFLPGSFPRPTQKTGPGIKNSVTKHAMSNYSIRLHPAFINLHANYE